MIENYLNTSEQLKMVFLLVDIRHAPNANDLQMYDWVIRSGYEPVVIATKLDKIKKNQVGKAGEADPAKRWACGRGTADPFSAQTKQGREEIWNLLEQSTGTTAM